MIPVKILNVLVGLCQITEKKPILISMEIHDLIKQVSSVLGTKQKSINNQRLPPF